MYTQCPECDVAFRVTAEVLQQARGKVRCGSCHQAFNALDHLSETPPLRPARETALAAPDASNEKSRALLDTLSELTGPDDVLIQDTGVEWRVLDEDTVSRLKKADLGIIESQEREADDADAPGDSVPAEDAAPSPNAGQPADDVAYEEPRYDDNTPLPDDFGEDDDEPSMRIYAAPQRRADDQVEAVINEDQEELELSDPDDWADLLGEVGQNTARPEEADEPVLDEPGDDIETLDVAGAEDEEIPELPPEDDADDAGEEGSGFYTNSFLLVEDEDGEVEITEVDDDGEDLDDLDLELAEDADAGNEPDIDVHVGEADVEVEPDFRMDAEDGPALDLHVEADSGADDDVNFDLDVESGHHSTATPLDFGDQPGEPFDPDGAADVDLDLADADDAETPAAEQDGTRDQHPVPDFPYAPGPAGDDGVETEGTFAADDDAALADSVDGSDEALSDDDLDSSGHYEVAIAGAETELEGSGNQADGAGAADGAETPVAEIDALERGKSARDDADEDAADALSDEEIDEEEDRILSMTANMAIDPEVLQAMRDRELAATMTNEDGSPMFEDIVMEGDVHDSLDEDEFTRGLKTQHGDAASLLDTYIASRVPDPKSRTGRILGGILVALLALGLAGQYVHSQRHTLATHPVFESTLAPLYRAIGMPVTPDWNVKGWQFETTNGSTIENDERLTISSRIANRSDQALPYPLVHVSLTDRFEEVIGSRILEPGEYLADGANPGRHVDAGDDFTATITIAAASEEATGFKLNVCYRELADQVRCAIEDFKRP